MNQSIPTPPDGIGPDSLDELFLRASRELPVKRQLGLLSVSVLHQSSTDDPETWQSYDSILVEIGRFLSDYRARRLRASDRMFWPSVLGNGFVVLLDAPRNGRPMNGMDVSRVGCRLRRSLRKHLARQIASKTLQAFGIYVGGSLMRFEASVPVERIVYRCREQSFADALKEKDREGRRYRINLRRVLEGRQLHMVYQPVVDLRQKKILGLEALARVPRGRFPNPEVLFQAAQQNETVWPLERLCRTRALEGLPPLKTDQRLFLNVEPESLHDPELIDPAFLRKLDQAGLSPSRVVLEITERTAIRDFGTIRALIRRCREYGYRVAMDDVGSGYAGLQAIAELAPDYIKIDMSLIRDLHQHTIKKELVATIRRFSDSTGITMVAEGVENRQELAALIEAGGRCAQGYFFSRPSERPAQPDWNRIPDLS